MEENSWVTFGLRAISTIVGVLGVLYSIGLAQTTEDTTGEFLQSPSGRSIVIAAVAIFFAILGWVVARIADDVSTR